MKIHQGWLTEDSKYFLIDDEKNEGFCTDRWRFAPKFFAELFCKTTTIVADVSDLKNPSLAGIYRGSSSSSDHNLFIKGNEVYETNYREGLRILDVSQIDSYDEEPQVQIGSVLGDVFSWMMSIVSIIGEKRQIMEEIAFFDIYPPDDCSERGAGSWSNYPYFDSGIVVVSAITQGLYVLKPDLEAAYKEREGEKL